VHRAQSERSWDGRGRPAKPSAATSKLARGSREPGVLEAGVGVALPVHLVFGPPRVGAMRLLVAHRVDTEFEHFRQLREMP
jgi:hypothetical protein